jgi:hypothetical protein
MAEDTPQILLIISLQPASHMDKDKEDGSYPQAKP